VIAASGVLTEWRNVQKVLCIRLDTLGDVLMTTPAIRAIKETLPHSHITLLTSPPGAQSVPFIPEIDDLLIYDAPWMKASPTRADSQYDQAMLEELRARRFDAAVIFTVYSQNPLPAALFCYMADIPLRLATCRENPYQLLTHWVKEIEPEQTIRHEVQRQLDLVASVGCAARSQRMRFCTGEGAQKSAVRKLTAAGVNLAHPWIAVHPGVTAPSRQYRPAGFAEAARSLAIEDGLQVVFTGGTGEMTLVEQIRDQMGVPSFTLAGCLSLEELAAVLERATLLIANNTGPVHVAAAVGTPVVDLYALTNPQHTPWGVPNRVLFHDVPCKYCYKSVCPMGHHDCLERVEPRQVVQAARELLAEVPSLE
jgi:lipopolysaccharide heptosyltransferase II